MENFKDAHYFPLPSQANIFTLAGLHLANGPCKLLVASLKREVFSFEYNETAKGVLVPTTREVSFTYIPSGAEIISLDAFNKSEEKNDFVIGITIIKNSNDSNTLETYLNIYSETEESDEFNLENIAQNCLNVELNYIPYHLTHTHVVVWNEEQLYSREVVFVLTGSDNQIHVYRENTTNHIYREIDTKEFFPEFYKPPSIVVWVDVLYFNNFKERLTAFGCECGYIRLCKICTKTNKIMFNVSTRFDQLISSVRLYDDTNQTKKPSLFRNKEQKDCKKQSDIVINLVVVNSILPAVFFGDVLRYGLNKYCSLTRCDITSIFTSSEVDDVDFDGRKEILLSNSLNEILLYRFSSEKNCWCLDETKLFPAPIYAVKYFDITGDGVKELIVLTMKGVHILQHDGLHVQKKIEEKLNSLNISNIETLKL